MGEEVANGSAVSIGWQMIGIIIAGVVGYFSAEVRTQSTISGFSAEIIGLRRDIENIEEWKEMTSNNRFTSLDGQRLRSYVDDRINIHSSLPAHSDVLPRLTSVEVRLLEIERTHRNLGLGSEVNKGGTDARP